MPEYGSTAERDRCFRALFAPLVSRICQAEAANLDTTPFLEDIKWFNSTMVAMLDAADDAFRLAVDLRCRPTAVPVPAADLDPDLYCPRCFQRDHEQSTKFSSARWCADTLIHRYTWAVWRVVLRRLGDASFVQAAQAVSDGVGSAGNSS